jgi:uncharacterized membrane protein YecN with MAPEG domain
MMVVEQIPLEQEHLLLLCLFACVTFCCWILGLALVVLHMVLHLIFFHPGKVSRIVRTRTFGITSSGCTQNERTSKQKEPRLVVAEN